MTNKWKVAVWTAIGLAILVIAWLVFRPKELRVLTGAVLQLDPVPGRQLPIANAEVTLADGLSTGSATSDPTGLFRLRLRPGVRIGQMVTVRLNHPGYRPMAIDEYVQDRPYVIRMVPASPEATTSGDPVNLVADVRVRYAGRTEITENVGSASKVFEVVNVGDTPCPRHSPCSPDGKWKAAVGGTALDAGEGSEFHDVRVSCIAGPCPFTKIENDSFSAGGRQISVSVKNWSDTASFLLEAEVTRIASHEGNLVSFPVIFGRTMSFTLPASARGPSIEASVKGESMVYPVGPMARLSWASCVVTVAKDRTKLYRCELKPGYSFK